MSHSDSSAGHGGRADRSGPLAVVWSHGSLRAPDDPTIRWDDHGFTVGDGVFETIELREGTPFALERHLRRLARSAEGLRLPPPDPATVRRAVSEAAAAWGTSPGRLRITYTAGPGPMGSDRVAGAATLVVVACEMTVRTDPTDVIVVPYVRNERGALVGLKTTSYAENVVALHDAALTGASEALFANTRDELCEGTGSNVVIELDGLLLTPPLSSGCLAGITRELLLDAMVEAGAPISVEPIPISTLNRVDGAFLLSTGRHVQPVRRIDGRELPACPGPATRTAAEVWATTLGALRGDAAAAV